MIHHNTAVADRWLRPLVAAAGCGRRLWPPVMALVMAAGDVW
jgi:hypothetical protein